MGVGDYSVYVFFPDGRSMDEMRWVDEETAVKVAARLVGTVGAWIGTINRIIITDGGDNTCFCWEYGKGVTFPPRDTWAKPTSPPSG